jgi:hypothetical protein
VSYHYLYIRISGACNGNIYGGTYSTAKYFLTYIYIYVLKYGGPPSDGGHPGGRRTGGRADTPAGGGQGGAILRMGIHAYAMGEGRTRREPQRGGREDVSAASPDPPAVPSGPRGVSVPSGPFDVPPYPPVCPPVPLVSRGSYSSIVIV